MKVSDLTWMQLESYLERDDRCVLPLGCTEQHAYLSLATDSTLAERVAIEAAEPLWVHVFPVLPYGITPYFMDYPGTVTLSPGTYERVLLEILAGLRRHGFRRIAIVNGHGGNGPARPAVEAWAAERKGVALRWHDWWRAPRVRAAVEAVDPTASHASRMESFPWTRIFRCRGSSGSEGSGGSTPGGGDLPGPLAGSPRRRLVRRLVPAE